jgi:endogenous inhibitor of DNA gyrase (YacG/DUF329 family)
MGMVVIKCPKTGKVIPTGVGMDKASFQTSSMSNNTVSCPACGGTHTWDKKDAWVQD